MSEPTCINLRERFGRSYRVVFDPAYSARHVPREKLDPWYMLVLCRRGAIWPHGGTTLAVELDGRRSITVRRLLATGVCTLYRDGDDGATLLFDLADWLTVAPLVNPRRRRVVSKVERERLRSMGTRYGFQSHQPEHGSEAPRLADVRHDYVVVSVRRGPFLPPPSELNDANENGGTRAAGGSEPSPPGSFWPGIPEG